MDKITYRLAGCLIIIFSSCIITDGATKTLTIETVKAYSQDNLHNETLNSLEKMGLCLKIGEDFIGYTENSGKYVQSNAFETGGGYFKASGSGVTWARGVSNVCMVYATILSEFPGKQSFTKYNIPRSQLLSHLRNAIRSLCLSNKNCSRYISEGHTWGGPAWQTSLEFFGAAWASHLVENELDADTVSLAKEILAKEADNLDKTIPTATSGNTASEDCCWNAPFLALAANKLSTDSRVSKWDRLAKKWAMNAVSTTADKTCTDIVDGNQVKDWMCTTNLFPDLTLENHGFWSIGYQFQVMMLADAELAYQAFGKPIPQAFSYHADEMWEKICAPMSLIDGDYVYSVGQDWNWKAFTHAEYFTRQFICRGDSRAAALESRCLQMSRKRQLSTGQGDMGYDYGTSTVGLRRTMMIYLLHKYFPNSVKRNFDEMSNAQNMQVGIFNFPYTKTAVHHTLKKMVSIAWHPQKQPIYIIPDAEQSFESPPLNITYNYMGGNTEVEVRVAGVVQTLSVTPGVVTNDSNIMTVRYQRKWGNAVTQYVTVVSLNDEATVYMTHFKANQNATVKIGQLFPVFPDFAAGFENKTFAQFRDSKWLNINDCLGFISPDVLPVNISTNRFWLKDSQEITVTAGQWFSPASVVVYVYQPHSDTQTLQPAVSYGSSSVEGQLILNLTSSSGSRQVSLF
jgi:hypothetical protein